MPKESLSTTDSHASPAGQGPAATAARTAAAAVVAAPPVAVETVAPAPAKEALRGLLIALGGRSNVRSVATSSSRLRIEVASAEAIDGAAIRQLGMRGVAIAAADCIHIIVGPGAAAAGASLRELLAV
jgi:phosphotransferase system IIB component